MPRKVSDEDKNEARRLFSEGRTIREIVSALGDRVSASWVSRVSRDEGWVKGLLPADMLSADQPQIYEPANASADVMAANNEKLQEANRRRWMDKKAELAAVFGEKIDLLLERAFSPHTLKEVKAVGMGGGVQDLRMVEIALELPPPADQVKLLTGVAILVDKASLLSGDATSRVETSSLTKDQVADRLKHMRDELGKRRDQKAIEPPKEETG
jgi:hypothetical protein